MEQSSQIDTFSRITQVSRETITSLKKYEKYLIKSNKTLNLIGKSTVNQIWIRHFLDSSQVIDFIDKNEKNLIDLGSGAGFPGLITAILAKDRNISLNVKLIEKSTKKVRKQCEKSAEKVRKKRPILIMVLAPTPSVGCHL